MGERRHAEPWFFPDASHYDRPALYPAVIREHRSPTGVSARSAGTAVEDGVLPCGRLVAAGTDLDDHAERCSAAVWTADAAA